MNQNPNNSLHFNCMVALNGVSHSSEPTAKWSSSIQQFAVMVHRSAAHANAQCRKCSSTFYYQRFSDCHRIWLYIPLLLACEIQFSTRARCVQMARFTQIGWLPAAGSANNDISRWFYCSDFESSDGIYFWLIVNLMWWHECNAPNQIYICIYCYLELWSRRAMTNQSRCVVDDANFILDSTDLSPFQLVVIDRCTLQIGLLLQ